VHLDRLRFLVLGAGAVGGYFGGRLVEANADVTFLVRPARAAALGERGLVIESPLGDLRLPVRVATADTLSGNFDTVLLTAKAYDLEPAIAAIRPAVGLETAILPLLNGLEHLDRLDAAFGPEHVLGGVAYIRGDLDRGGEYSPSQPRARHGLRRAIRRNQPPGRDDRSSICRNSGQRVGERGHHARDVGKAHLDQRPGRHELSDARVCRRSPGRRRRRKLDARTAGGVRGGGRRVGVPAAPRIGNNPARY